MVFSLLVDIGALAVKWKKEFFFVSFLVLFVFCRFCGYIICKPSRDLARPLGGANGFKALVVYAK